MSASKFTPEVRGGLLEQMRSTHLLNLEMQQRVVGEPLDPLPLFLQAEGSNVVVTDIAGARFVSRYHPRIVERVVLKR